MKKVFAFVAVAAAMLVAGTASAQLSVNAGYTGGSMIYHSETTVGSTTTNFDTTSTIGGGFYVGGSYNVELMGGLGIAPGIYFNYINKKEVETRTILGVETTTTDNTKMMNINIPILLNYKLTFGDDFAIFAFAGPDIVFGINANSKSVTKAGSTENTYENDLYKKDNNEEYADMTRLDMGLMFGAGVQFSNFCIEAGYELGMLNRAGDKKGSESVLGVNYSYKNDYKFNRFFVGVGYAF